MTAGAYPRKKGSGTINVRPEVLQQLLDSGVNTFINLTEDEYRGGDSFLEMYDPFYQTIASLTDIQSLM